MPERKGVPQGRNIRDRRTDLERQGLHIPTGWIRGRMLAGEFWMVKKTDDYTAGAEMVILADATSKDITITLPAAASSPGKVYYIKKIDTTNHKVVIDGYSGEEIDNDSTYDIAYPYTCITVLCDGAEWWII